MMRWLFFMAPRPFALLCAFVMCSGCAAGAPGKMSGLEPAQTADPTPVPAETGDSADAQSAPYRETLGQASDKAHLSDVDDKTLLGAICPGHEAPHAAGSVVVGERQDLPDGRQAVWVYTAESSPEPGSPTMGYIALVRLDKNTLSIDAVGPWENSPEAKRTVTGQQIDGRTVWVESTGPVIDGECGQTLGEQVWLEEDGSLVRAGAYPTEGFSGCLGSEGLYRTQVTETEWKGRQLILHEAVIWQCSKTWSFQDIIKTSARTIYELSGTKLVLRARPADFLPTCKDGVVFPPG
jgi:hypothetical protein